jgi:hypothetical protein
VALLLLKNAEVLPVFKIIIGTTVGQLMKSTMSMKGSILSPFSFYQAGSLSFQMITGFFLIFIETFLCPQTKGQ